jgi:hypothetical protein
VYLFRLGPLFVFFICFLVEPLSRIGRDKAHLSAQDGTFVCSRGTVIWLVLLAIGFFLVPVLDTLVGASPQTIDYFFAALGFPALALAFATSRYSVILGLTSVTLGSWKKTEIAYKDISFAGLASRGRSGGALYIVTRQGKRVRVTKFVECFGELVSRLQERVGSKASIATVAVA